MKKYCFGKKNQICSFVNLDNFCALSFNMGSMVVLIRAGQLLPQILMEPFDTLPSQYRHTRHMHEEILFWKNIFLRNLQLCELR